MPTIARGTKAGGGTNFNSGQIIDPAEVNDDFNTLYSVVNGNLDDDNVATASLPGAKSLRFTEISDPSSPSSDDLLVYAKDASGVTRLYTKDSAGTVISPSYSRRTGSTTLAHIGGTLSSQILSVGTDANTSLKILASYNVPANTLSATGDRLHLVCAGGTAANANNKSIMVFLGGTLIYTSGALAANGDVWLFDVWIARSTSATTCYAIGTLHCYNTITPVSFLSNIAADWTTVQVVSVNGQNGTASANDIICGNYFLTYHPVGN